MENAIHDAIEQMSEWDQSTPKRDVQKVIRRLRSGIREREFVEIVDIADDFDMARQRRESTGVMDTESALLGLQEPMRTGMFVRAIRDASARKDIQHALDGGCGPIPVLSLAIAHYNEAALVKAVEGNPMSANLATRIIANGNASEQIEIRKGDCRSRIEALVQNSFDLIVSETFSSGMTDEKGVQILQNMVRWYAKEDAVVLPESATVQFALVPSKSVGKKKVVLTFDEDSEAKPFLFTPGSKLDSDTVDAQVQCKGLQPGEYCLVATTQLQVDSNKQLMYPDAKSAITNPIVLFRDITVDHPLDETDKLRVRYTSGAFLDARNPISLPAGMR